jgi:hypothetical protein
VSREADPASDVDGNRRRQVALRLVDPVDLGGIQRPQAGTEADRVLDGVDIRRELVARPHGERLVADLHSHGNAARHVQLMGGASRHVVEVVAKKRHEGLGCPAAPVLARRRCQPPPSRRRSDPVSHRLLRIGCHYRLSLCPETPTSIAGDAPVRGTSQS